MSMGNFMGVSGVVRHVMATNQQPRHGTTTSPDTPGDGAGMAHLTVVPTNFDPDEERRG